MKQIHSIRHRLVRPKVLSIRWVLAIRLLQPPFMPWRWGKHCRHRLSLDVVWLVPKLRSMATMESESNLVLEAPFISIRNDAVTIGTPSDRLDEWKIWTQNWPKKKFSRESLRFFCKMELYFVQVDDNKSKLEFCIVFLSSIWILCFIVTVTAYVRTYSCYHIRCRANDSCCHVQQCDSSCQMLSKFCFGLWKFKVSTVFFPVDKNSDFA